jgi:hypothetical protein
MNTRLLSLSKAIKSRYSLFLQEAIPSEGYSLLPLIQSIFKIYCTPESFFTMYCGKWSDVIFSQQDRVLKMNLS